MTKKKYLYTVTYLSLSHTIQANNHQHATKLALRYWLKNGDIKRQPPSIYGAYEGVEVTSHENQVVEGSL